MNASLRPMELGEIFDRTFHIYRTRFALFVGLSLFPAIGMTLLECLNLFWWRLHVPDLLHILGVNIGLVFYLVGEYHCTLFLHALVWPPLVMVASQAHLGEKPGIGSSLRLCAMRWKSWVGLSLMVQVMVVLLAEVSATALLLAVGALVSWLLPDGGDGVDVSMSAALGVSMVGGFAISLWLGTLYLNAVPAWCAEGLNLRRSFKRARTLSHGSRWRSLVLRLAPVAMLLVLDIAVSTTLASYVRFTHHPWWIFARTYNCAYVAFTGLVSAVMTPVFPIALTLFYYDQRIRKEAFDIEYMMETAGLVADAAVATTANDAESPECAPVTAEELGA